MSIVISYLTFPRKRAIINLTNLTNRVNQQWELQLTEHGSAL